MGEPPQGRSRATQRRRLRSLPSSRNRFCPCCKSPRELRARTRDRGARLPEIEGMRLHMSPNPVTREQLVREAFESAAVAVYGLDVKSYPDETNIIVYVSEADLPRAAQLGNEVDD